MFPAVLETCIKNAYKTPIDIEGVGLGTFVMPKVEKLKAIYSDTKVVINPIE